MSRGFNPFLVWTQVPIAYRTIGGFIGDMVGNITGNLSGSVGSVTGPVGSVTGSVGGNVTGQVVQMIRSVQTVTITINSTAGTYTAAISAVTLAKSRLIPLSFNTPNLSGVYQILYNWDFASVTRVQVEATAVTGGSAQTAKVMIVEYY